MRAAAGAMPGVERQVLVGWCRSSQPSVALLERLVARAPARRPILDPSPLLSLRPESFAPSVAPSVVARGALSRLSGARGPLCLRDSGGGCSFGAADARGMAALSRARLRQAGSGRRKTGAALARALAESIGQRSGSRRLARGVVAELVLGQLEADQMLEGRPGDRGANRRDRDSGSIAASASPALRSRVSSLRMSSGRVAAPRSTPGPVAWPLVWARTLPAAKLSATWPTRLATTLRAALHDDVEIGQRRPCAPRRRRGAWRRRRSVTVETTLVAVFVAARRARW